MRTSQEIFKQLESITNLPTLPNVIQKLGEVIRDPNSNAKRIAGIIEDDPAMMARILKVVNSAFYAGTEPITSIQHAVSRMGMKAINNIAMSTAVFSTFKETEGEEIFKREEFWRHSICNGIAMEVVYDKTKGNLARRISKDILHLAGLLHDIGKIILDQFFHEEFNEALKASIEGKKSLQHAEAEVMETDHSEIGAWLGTKWNLSEDLIQTIRWHHNPDSAQDAHWELTALCHTANYICNIEKIGDSGDSTPEYINGVWKRLGLEVGDISEVVDEVSEESKKSETLMSFTQE